ncbi:uncharacterized, partial [Tachysurus ichikawai]
MLVSIGHVVISSKGLNEVTLKSLNDIELKRLKRPPSLISQEAGRMTSLKG